MPPLELLRDFLEEPEKAARDVQERPPVALGVAAYLLAGLSLFLAKALSGRLHFLGISSLSLSILCIWRVLIGVGSSAFLHLVIEALGGKGRAVPLFVLMGLSDMGWALALPGILLLRAVFPDFGWSATAIFFFVGFLTAALKARSIEHNYQVAPGKAWLALLLPYVGAAALALLAAAVVLAGAFHQIIQLFS